MTADLAGIAAHLEDEAKILGRDLHAWARRDDSKPQPEVRQAANRAMSALDRALRDLYQARQRLVSEIRASDDATARRVDALIASIRQERGTG